MRQGDDELVVRYRGRAVPMLPSTLRRAWAGQVLGDALPGVAGDLAARRLDAPVTALDLPEGERRPLASGLVRVLAVRTEDVIDLPLVAPRDLHVDVEDMPGWPGAVLVAAAAGPLVDLADPPTFGRLLDVPGARTRDALQAACLLEALLEAELGDGASSGSAEVEELAATTSWVARRLRLDVEAAGLLLTLVGLRPGPVPTRPAVARRLGVSGSQLAQVVSLLYRTMAEEPERLPGIDHLRKQVLLACASPPAARPERLARVTGSPEALADLLDECGEDRLATVLREGAPSLEDAFVQAVVDAVRSWGALAARDLVDLLADWECDETQVLYACGVSPDVRVVAGRAYALGSGSALAAGVLRALAARDPQPVVAAYVGAMRHLRQRGTLRPPTPDDFRTFLEVHPSFAVTGDAVRSLERLPEPGDLETALLQELDRAPSGLLLRDELARRVAARGWRATSVKQYVQGSPYVELACTGVVRRRGTESDLSVAERLRRETATGPRWAAWGWLDAQRLWVECRLTPRGLVPDLPRDLDVLLNSRAFRCLAADRTPLGVLEVQDDGRLGWFGVEEAPVPNDLTSVLELRVGQDPALVVLSGETATEEDEYQGDVDACVLHDGRWWSVLVVDDALLEGDAHLLPHVVLRDSPLAVGEERLLEVAGRGHVVLRREPHAGVLLGLGDVLRRSGATAREVFRVLVDGSQLLVRSAGRPPSGSFARLMAAGGLAPEDGTASFPVLGAALGLSGRADRSDVARAFLRRGRPDLARAARDVRPAREATSAVEGPRVRVRDGAVVVVDASDRPLRPVPPGPGIARGPLGVAWVEETSAAVADRAFVRWMLAYTRVWAAAVVRGPQVVVWGGTAWSLDAVPHRRLVEAWEAVSLPPDVDVALPQRESGRLPATGLGFLHLVRAAVDAGISELRVEDEQVVAVMRSGVRTGQGLLDVLS